LKGQIPCEQVSSAAFKTSRAKQQFVELACPRNHLNFQCVLFSNLSSFLLFPGHAQNTRQLTAKIDGQLPVHGRQDYRLDHGAEPLESLPAEILE
jgi:hypothetical protein